MMDEDDIPSKQELQRLANQQRKGNKRSKMQTIKKQGIFSRKKVEKTVAVNEMPKPDDTPATIRMKDADRDTYHCNQTRKI